MAIEHAVYTAQATSTGGRTGTTSSSDGEINLTHDTEAVGWRRWPGYEP